MRVSWTLTLVAIVLTGSLSGCHSSKKPRPSGDAAVDHGAEGGIGPADADANRIADSSPDAAKMTDGWLDGIGITDAALDMVEFADAPIDTPVDANVARADLGAGEAPLAPLCSDNNPCTADLFDGTQCTHAAVANGTRCDDGSLCLLAGSCQDGRCAGGTSITGTMAELGRLDSFGHEHGIVVSTGDGHILFADRVDYDAVLHTAHFDNESLVVEKAVYPDPNDDNYLPNIDYGSVLHVGWPGHVATSTANTESVFLITIDQAGVPTLHPQLTVPASGGFLMGNVNGLAGWGSDLWVCVNYSFFGPASGTLIRYDITDPGKPIISQAINSPSDCGSLAVSPDGRRVYFNSTKGIYWFDPDSAVSADAGASADADTDDTADAGASADAGGGRVVVHGPFGVNSGLTMFGSTLMSRADGSVVLYDATDQTEILRVTQAGLTGSTYLPEQQLLVLMRREKQTDGLFKFWLYVQPSDGGAVSDEVLLGDVGMTATRLPTSGDVVFEPRSKVAFRVVGGKLKRLSLPMLGGFGTLTGSGQSVEAWSPTAWHSIDVSNPSNPTWLEPGGPVPGRVRATGIDVGMTALLDDPGFADQYTPPRPGRVVANASYLRQQDSLVLAVRDGKLWSQTTDVGSVLLAGKQVSVLAWSAESLYRFDTATPLEAHLRRWDSALLVPSLTPVPASEDLTIPLLDLPTSAKPTQNISLDFPPMGNVGLAEIPYTVSGDGGSIGTTLLVWIQRSPLQVLFTTSLPDLAFDCRMAQQRAACVSSTQLFLVEMGSDAQSTVVRQIPLPRPDDSYVGILGFDGLSGYLSERDALRAFAFDSTAEQLANAPTIKFSHYPLTMTDVPGALVVASNHELVTLSPQCLGR
jgi:hypothetical protein